MNDIAKALLETLLSPNVSDSNGESANIVDAISGLGGDILLAAKRLGNNGTSTPMGAIEAHGLAVLDASKNIANAIHDLAEAVRESCPAEKSKWIIKED